MTAPPVPPAQPIEGANALDALHEQFTRYVVFPSPAAADAVTLWTAATHAQTAFAHATRLGLESPLRQCGKTRVLEILAETAHRPLRTANISTAALVRSIEEGDPPTILLDEADALFAKRRGESSEQAEATRGILNAGHSRDWPYVRYNASSRQTERWPTFAMAAIAAIGELPSTVEDRAIVIHMRRRAPGERIAPFRRRHAIPPLHDVRDQLAAWATEHRDAIADARPALPVEDRPADVWEPIVAIADVAGGDWPQRARAACLALTSGDDPDAGAESERLLSDLRAIFYPEHAAPIQRLITNILLDRLKSIDDAPWSEWAGGRGLSARALALLLRQYGVRPSKWSEGARGYERSSLEDAWQRYARPNSTTRRSATDSHEPQAEQGTSAVADEVADCDPQSATGGNLDRTRPTPHSMAGVAVPASGARCCDCGSAPVEEPGELCDACLADALAGILQ